MNEPIHPWSTSTKRTVALIILVLLALVVYRFRDVIPPLAIALLLAFIIDPAVDFLTARLPLSRGSATAILFLALVLIGVSFVMAAPATAVPTLQQAVRIVEVNFSRIITETGNLLKQPIEIMGYPLDLNGYLDLNKVYQELSKVLRSFVTSVAHGTLGVARNVASGAFWLIFILMAAFYLVKDADNLIEQIDALAPPGYRDDFVRLRQQITGVWHAFLRGQLLLCLAMTVITTVACMAVGLSYAGVLGLLAGVMEFVPTIGPIIAMIPAVLVALFGGSNFLALSNFWFAVVVLGLYVVIQQIEGTILVPRILGRSLNLHPLLVLIGFIVGGSLAGLLGMLLAAPVLATLRILINYIFHRLYDRDPFVELEEKTPRPRLLTRSCQKAWCWLQKRIEQRGYDS